MIWPTGNTGNIWRHFQLSQQGVCVKVLLALGGERPGTLPTSQDMQAGLYNNMVQNVHSAETEKPCLGEEVLPSPKAGKTKTQSTPTPSSCFPLGFQLALSRAFNLPSPVTATGKAQDSLLFPSLDSDTRKSMFELNKESGDMNAELGSRKVQWCTLQSTTLLLVC